MQGKDKGLKENASELLTSFFNPPAFTCYTEFPNNSQAWFPFYHVKSITITSHIPANLLKISCNLNLITQTPQTNPK